MLLRRIRRYAGHLRKRIRLNPRAFRVYMVLRALVILTAVRCVLTRNWESFFLCVLSLWLFLMPSFFEEKLRIMIPAGFQITIYLFVYAAEILGEVNKYYTAIPGWDTMLHTINGFLCAAIGLSLVDILNRGSSSFHLSPFYLALMAFSFSMTIGVLWEFLEFGMDQLFYLDMQKDFIVKDIGSVTLDASRSQIPVHLQGITRTIVEMRDGSKVVIEGGYLDIGIIDTMKDLLVNFLGAVVFSVSGYFYEKNRTSRSLAADMRILPMSEAEMEEQEEEMERLEEKQAPRSRRRKRREK